jgi:hypothetical protein
MPNAPHIKQYILGNLNLFKLMQDFIQADNC